MWLNYQHLNYFWTVAREGSIARACPKLHVAPPTVSAQIHQLEEALGEKLFVRQGRGLVLTEMGRVAYRYAEEIFTLGRELVDTVKDRPTGRPQRLSIGITDVVPKLVVRRLLGPLRRRPDPFRLTCVEDGLDPLLLELAAHGVDVLIADSPTPVGSKVRAFSHQLGACGVSLFAAPALARRYRAGFPRSLDGAPVLLPTETSGLRRSLDDWFNELGIRPEIVVEADDSALLNALGQDGMGIFPALDLVEGDVRGMYGVRPVGRATPVRAGFWALSVERRVRHPGVAALLEAARSELLEVPGRAGAEAKPPLSPA